MLYSKCQIVLTYKTSIANCGTKPFAFQSSPAAYIIGRGIFATGNLCLSKAKSFCSFAPENPQDFSGNWWGARRLRAVRETGRSKPNEQRSFASGSAARRLLRIVEGGSGGGTTKRAPVGEAARSKPNKRGRAAPSLRAQRTDHCELWIVYSLVHQIVK